MNDEADLTFDSREDVHVWLTTTSGNCVRHEQTTLRWLLLSQTGELCVPLVCCVESESDASRIDSYCSGTTGIAQHYLQYFDKDRLLNDTRHDNSNGTRTDIL